MATVCAFQNPCIHHHVLFYSINTKLPSPPEVSCNNRDIPSPFFTFKPIIKPHAPLLAFLISKTNKSLSRIQMPTRKCIWKIPHPMFQPLPTKKFSWLENFFYIRTPCLNTTLFLYSHILRTIATHISLQTWFCLSDM